MDFLDFFGQVLDSMTTEFLTDSLYSGSARVIAGLGALIGVGLTFMKIVSFQADSSEGWKYMAKIIVVSSAITAYPYLIQFINAPLDVIGYTAKRVAYTEIDESADYFRSFREDSVDAAPNNADYDEKIQGYAAETGFDLGEQTVEEDSDGLFSIGRSMMFEAINGPLTKIRSYIMEAMMSTLNFFGKVAFTILNVVRTFFLIILGVFGIFAIALSVYPTMEDSWSVWLKKYINVYLWLPIGYIMLGIINRLYKFIRVDGPTSLPEIMLSDPEFIVDTASGSIMAGMLGVVAIVSTISIPTMSSWLVNVSTAQLGSKIKSKGQGQMSNVGSKMKTIGKEAAKAKATAGTSVGAAAAKNIIS